VYALGKDTGAKGDYQKTIAGFWDCNPFAIQTSGHMMIGNKKISPGAHWLDITAIAAGVAGLDFDHTLEAQALVAATLMDAFICCWDAKYQSNRIRPETYINRYIDDRWQPYLQTPPFPEYTSGHSVISTAAAEMLTYLLGDRLDFTDNTEELWDIRPRSFHSFRQAAEEAAISRLYGGIHYRDGVISGQVQGKAIGDWLVSRVKRSGIKPLR
jgi:membrane-associated phospholipid phosphatase